MLISGSGGEGDSSDSTAGGDRSRSSCHVLMGGRNSSEEYEYEEEGEEEGGGGERSEGEVTHDQGRFDGETGMRDRNSKEKEVEGGIGGLEIKEGNKEDNEDEPVARPLLCKPVPLGEYQPNKI